MRFGLNTWRSRGVSLEEGVEFRGAGVFFQGNKNPKEQCAAVVNYSRIRGPHGGFFIRKETLRRAGNANVKARRDLGGC